MIEIKRPKCESKEIEYIDSNNQELLFEDGEGYTKSIYHCQKWRRACGWGAPKYYTTGSRSLSSLIFKKIAQNFSPELCNFYEKNLIKNARKLYQSILKGGIIISVRKR